MRVTYNRDCARRLRVAMIGCGGHAYRNILPTVAYLPVDLVAACDLDPAKADSAVRLFGAGAAYTDHLAMLEREKPDAVFVVTGYDADGRCLYPRIAAEAMARGAHAWVEKPPLNDLADVALLREAIARSGRTFAVGFKKMFFPANARLKAITADPSFGAVRTIAIRYPQYLPTADELAYRGRERARQQPRIGFLDHLCHPLSLLQLLGGRIRRVSHTRAGNGAGFACLGLESGAEAVIHFTHGQSGSSPLERVEVTGDGGNAVVENNIRLTWYRPVRAAGFRAYGQDGDFTGPMDDAPLVWEPEFSLGSLGNKSTFILGYHAELQHFCEAALAGRPVTLGTLDHAEEGIRVLDAFARGPGVTTDLGAAP
jgi:predicted dehydrogenase